MSKTPDLITLKAAAERVTYHIIFRTPRPCANKNRFPNGIDVRGDVGYIVGAGSKIDAGEWSVIDPSMPIMDIPEWLLDYLVSPGVKSPNADVPLIDLDQPENVQQAMEWLKTAKPAIEGENGDDHTYDVCCMLRDFGISETEAAHVLNESGWNERCEPAWDEWELASKVRNAYSFAQNRPGVKAESYQRDKLMACRPTAEQLDALGHNKSRFKSVPLSRHRKSRRPRIQLIGE